MRFDGFAIAVEEEGDAPKSRKRNDGIDKAAEQGVLTAEQPCHRIEPKQSDRTPVERTDNADDQRNSVKHRKNTSYRF